MHEINFFNGFRHGIAIILWLTVKNYQEPLDKNFLLYIKIKILEI